MFENPLSVACSSRVTLSMPGCCARAEASRSVDELSNPSAEARKFGRERYMYVDPLALDSVVVGLLGEAVASSARSDPQVKTPGERLTAKLLRILVELPEGPRASCVGSESTA